MVKQYEISDEDIEVMLRHLKATDPKNATHEQAKAKLEELQAGFHKIAHTDPEKFGKLRSEIDSYKRKESDA